MEIRNLITFLQIAEQGSFSKAATVLNYAQSTVSFQIKQLESELGCPLFDRIGHTVTLTPRGRELMDYARQVTHLTEEFVHSGGADGQVEGLLRIAAPDSVCEDMMNTNYTDFHRTWPGISLKFTNTDTETMFRMLSRNEADLIVTLDRHAYDSEYIIAKEEPVAMHFVTGVGSPFAAAGKLSIRDLLDKPFILTEKRIAYRRGLDEALAQMSLEIDPILELGRTDIIMNMLEAGVGIGFLPEFVTRRRVEQGRLCYLNVTDVEVDVWKQLIYHRNKWITKGLSALIEYIKANEFGR
ncbi:MAG: LysR family transcriptional regulator [Clostridia bacterium]|nr:LysR family transcriptional regulator [Clostridia bacterium]